MNEHVIDVGLVEAAALELLGGEADYALVVQEDLQRVARGYQHVQADVEFQIVNQKGFLQVLLHHNPLVLIAIALKHDLFHIISEEYSLALALAVRLHDEREVRLPPTPLLLLSPCHRGLLFLHFRR
jgi:hypothetical protein